MEYVVLPLFFVAMYFVLIRPQRKRQQEVVSMQQALGPGDEVITIGGLHGEVTEVTDDYVDLLVSSDGLVLRYKRSAVADITRSVGTSDASDDVDWDDSDDSDNSDHEGDG